MSCGQCGFENCIILIVIFVAVADGQPQEKATLGQEVTLPCYIDYSDVSETPSNIPVVSQLLVLE